ncbi:MAG TPA: AraC family transcriptional regulator [Vicinamibacterales bacterium]|nr:AraC family transcriptional regulator [Vicinamibacterales bacterium]
MNRAVDYVLHNLAEPLLLEDVARAAGFSPFHFHRVFRAHMGETLGAFVRRVRLERALYLLSHRRGATMTSIALACGFSSSSDFSRAFRACHGVSPRQFDVAAFRRSRREDMRIAVRPVDTTSAADSARAGGNPDGFAVHVRRLAARRVAYLRVRQPYTGDHVPKAANRLLAWAQRRGLADGQWLGYQWDDPEIVPLGRCRYDVGVEIPDAAAVSEEVNVTWFPETVVAEVEIKGTLDLELRALQWIFLTWLPGSGYAPAHQPMFEAWNGRPYAHGTTHFDLRIQLPVVDASTPL